MPALEVTEAFTVIIIASVAAIQGPAPSGSGAFHVSVIVVPISPDAGTDQTICGITAASLNANVVTGGNWTGGAGTFNPNRNTANATYTPVAGEIGTTITLTWNAPDPDGAGPCIAAATCPVSTRNDICI